MATVTNVTFDGVFARFMIFDAMAYLQFFESGHVFTKKHF